MAKNAWQGFTLLLLALPFGASAQNAAEVLESAAEALRIGEVKALKLVASGSGYEVRADDERPAETAAEPQPAPAVAGLATSETEPSSAMYVPPPAKSERSYYRIVSETQTLDLGAESLEIEQVRAESSAPDAERQPPATTTIDASAEWPLRHRYWLTPHAFVAGALANDASVGTETVGGVEYRVVSFTVDGHEVRGYVDDQARLARIRTTVESDDGGTADVVESFFDWADRGELTYPSTLIRKENGELAEVLVVRELDTGAS